MIYSPFLSWRLSNSVTSNYGVHCCMARLHQGKMNKNVKSLRARWTPYTRVEYLLQQPALSLVTLRIIHRIMINWQICRFLQFYNLCVQDVITCRNSKACGFGREEQSCGVPNSNVSFLYLRVFRLLSPKFQLRCKLRCYIHFSLNYKSCDSLHWLYPPHMKP